MCCCSCCGFCYVATAVVVVAVELVVNAVAVIVDLDVALDCRVDANGILHAPAQGKPTGKSNHITSMNEKGRLSQAEVYRMAHNAEKYAVEDEANSTKVEAENGPENC